MTTDAAARDAALRATLARAGVGDAQWEASVRADATQIRGGRMMVERARREHARTVWDALELEWSDAIERLARAAESAGVPLIAGWDVSGAAPIAKLYVNASDEATASRTRIAHDLGWPGLEALAAVPHVLAVNASSRTLERKAYVQRAASAHVADEIPHEHARWLDDVARSAKAGHVTSWDVAPDGSARTRAFFVALRGDDANDAIATLERLPWWSAEAVDRALPFARGQCRSIGVDLRADARTWTAYFKPRGHGLLLHDLEPVARFAWADHVLGIYVEPSEQAARAYARTARSAISFRSANQVPREPLERLMRWVVERIDAAESHGVDPARALDTPPHPWARCP